MTISIHALLAESDYIFVNTFLAIFEFLSTLSLRRATENSLCQVVNRGISIHALLAESDAIYPSSTPPKEYFYPRSPCGERR